MVHTTPHNIAQTGIFSETLLKIDIYKYGGFSRMLQISGYTQKRAEVKYCKSNNSNCAINGASLSQTEDLEDGT